MDIFVADSLRRPALQGFAETDEPAGVRVNKVDKELEGNTVLSHYRIVSKIGATVGTTVRPVKHSSTAPCLEIRR